MAAVPGAAPAPPLYSYGPFFENHDPFNEDYSLLLGPYNVPPGGGDGPAPAQVRSLACAAWSTGIATAHFDIHEGKLSVYIQLDRIVPQLGLADSPWLDTNIAQLGDLISNQAVLVELPDALWNRGPVVRVGTFTLVEAALNGDPDLQFMGPFNDDDADTELVRTRRSCPIPPFFVRGILALGRNPTVRQVWAYVYPICVDGIAPDASFLRLRPMTCRGGKGNWFLVKFPILPNNKLRPT